MNSRWREPPAPIRGCWPGSRAWTSSSLTTGASRPVDDQQRQDLLEILEDRYGLRATVITSQLAPTLWHEYLAHPTLADAICDRILHHAHRIELKGESMRKVRAKSAEGG